MPLPTNLKAEQSAHRGSGGLLGWAVNRSFPNTCFRRDFFQEKFFVLIGPVESVYAGQSVLVVRRGVVGMNSAPIDGQVGTACGRMTAVHSPSQFIHRCGPLSTWLSTGVNQWWEGRKNCCRTDLESGSNARNMAKGEPIDGLALRRTTANCGDYLFDRCLIRAVSSWTWSYTLRRSVISLRIFLSAYITVV